MAGNEVSEMGCAYWTTREIILRLPEEEDGRWKLRRFRVQNKAELRSVRQLPDVKLMKAVISVRLRSAVLRKMTAMSMMTTMTAGGKRRKGIPEFWLHWLLCSCWHWLHLCLAG